MKTKFYSSKVAKIFIFGTAATLATMAGYWAIYKDE